MYEDFYSLKGNPFNLTPDTRILFRSPGHNRVLSFLRYGILKREGFVVVTGKPGTGKSTLIRVLLDEILEKEDLKIAHLEMTQADSNELLSMIAEAFEINHEGLSKASILRNLSRFLTNEIQRGKQPILIVDEAQNLCADALETLRLLINYQTGNVPLLQGFLIGQDSFARTLAESETMESTRQRIITSCHLAPLSPSETKEYITYRLHMTGWSNDPVFTPQALSAVYGHTGGVPRLVNTLCDRALLLGFINETHEISEKLIGEVIRELGSQSFSTDTNSQDIQAKHWAHSKQIPSSQPSNAAPHSDVETLKKRLSEIELHLESVDNSVSSQDASSEDHATQLRREVVQLQAQLTKALTDKERLQEELDEQKDRAEQVQKALENDIKYLLTRISALKQNPYPGYPGQGQGTGKTTENGKSG